jgi:hypothetical protein
MKKATATSHGNNRFMDSLGATGRTEAKLELVGLILVPNQTVINPALTSKLEQRGKATVVALKFCKTEREDMAERSEVRMGVPLPRHI